MDNSLKSKIENQFGYGDPRIKNEEAQAKIKATLENIKPFFKEYGFKKTKAIWVKRCPKIETLFHVRKDLYGNRVYLDFGVSVPLFGYPESLTSSWWHIFGEFNPKFNQAYMDFDNQITIEERVAALKGFLQNQTFGFFELNGEIEQLRTFTLESGAHCFDKNIQNYLSLGKF